MMEIDHRVENNIYLFEFEGTLALEGAESAREYIFDLLESANLKGVIFNWEYVDYVGSQGVTLVLSVYSFLQNHQKKIVLCHLNKTNEEMLAGLALDKYIETYPTVEDALASF